MATSVIKGKDINIFAGDILWGCADDISLEVSVGEDKTSCRAAASSRVNTFTPGNIDITGSVSSTVRQATGADAVTNFTAENVLDAALAGTVLEFRYSIGSGPGAVRYTAPGFFTKASISGGSEGDGKASASIRLTEMPVKTIEPA